jgi:hypothetical protein
MATFSTGAMLGPIIGPTFGGCLTNNSAGAGVGALEALGIFILIPHRPIRRKKANFTPKGRWRPAGRPVLPLSSHCLMPAQTAHSGGQRAIPDLPPDRCRRTTTALRRAELRCDRNDMLFRAGQLPCRLFARAALLRQVQGSGWRSSDPTVATRPDRA